MNLFLALTAFTVRTRGVWAEQVHLRGREISWVTPCLLRNM